MSRISNELLEPLYSVTREDWQPFFNANSMATGRFLIIVSYHINFSPPTGKFTNQSRWHTASYRTGLSVFATCPCAVIHLIIVAHHGDVG